MTVRSSGFESAGAVVTWSEMAGLHPDTDWAHWLREVGAASSGDGIGFGTSWEDDLAQLGEVGFDEFVVTLEWAVLEPQPGHYDAEAVERFQTLLQQARARGMQPWACLVDGSLPGWFAVDEHGFVDDRSRKLLWPRHVEWIGETFGHLVNGWVPQREAIHQAVRSHLLGLGPPGLRLPDRTGKAVRAALLADGEAWRVLRGSAPVASYQTARTFVPMADNVAAARHAADLDDLYRARWVEALEQGIVEFDGLPTVSAPHLRGAFDRVVLQLRPPVSIDAEGNWAPLDRRYLIEAMADSFATAAAHVPDTHLVAAADLAPVEATLDDPDSSAQTEHLLELMEATRERGAHTWWQTSPFDGWSWERGFDGRPGIIDANRKPRNVADVFR